MTAVADPTCKTNYNGIQFKVWRDFLCLRLPSGRVLYYKHPRIMPKTFILHNEDGSTYEYNTKGLIYWGVDSTTHQWTKQDTYGGSLTENIVQAIARDLLVNSMLAVEDNGYGVVFHVHDEIVSETPENFGTVEQFNELVCTLPDWATGLPLRADSWKGKRYKK
jgi:DNA polymerase